MKQRKILYADEGKVLTDGEHYAKVVYLADGENEDKWTEIEESEQPAEERMEEEGT